MQLISKFLIFYFLIFMNLVPFMLSWSALHCKCHHRHLQVSPCFLLYLCYGIHLLFAMKLCYTLILMTYLSLSLLIEILRWTWNVKVVDVLVPILRDLSCVYLQIYRPVCCSYLCIHGNCSMHLVKNALLCICIFAYTTLCLQNILRFLNVKRILSSQSLLPICKLACNMLQPSK